MPLLHKGLRALTVGVVRETLLCWREINWWSATGNCLFENWSRCVHISCEDRSRERIREFKADVASARARGETVNSCGWRVSESRTGVASIRDTGDCLVQIKGEKVAFDDHLQLVAGRVAKLYVKSGQKAI